MDEALCLVRSTSAAGRTAPSRRRSRRPRSRASTRSWLRSSSARWPTTRADASPAGARGLQRAPHDRGCLQGVRPRAASGGCARSDRARRSLHQGCPVSGRPRIAVLDYGMGNLRSVEKALERSGARRYGHPRPRGYPRGGRSRASRRRRISEGDAQPARARPRRRCSRRSCRGHAHARICLGLQLLFESSSENEGARGLGFLKGTVERLPAPGLKVPLIGWNPVAWTKGLRASPTGCPTLPVLLRPFLCPAGVDDDDRAWHGRVRRAVRVRGRARHALRGPVPPGEVERARPAAARELRFGLRVGRRALVAGTSWTSTRRSTSSTARPSACARGLRRQERLCGRLRRRGRALGGRWRPGPARRRSRRRESGAAGQSRSPPPHLRARCRAPSSTGADYGLPMPLSRRSRPARHASSRDRRLHRRRVPGRRHRKLAGASRRRCRRARRPRLDGRLDAAVASCEPAAPSRHSENAAYRRSSTRTSTATGC